MTSSRPVRDRLRRRAGHIALFGIFAASGGVSAGRAAPPGSSHAQTEGDSKLCSASFRRDGAGLVDLRFLIFVVIQLRYLFEREPDRRRDVSRTRSTLAGFFSS